MNRPSSFSGALAKLRKAIVSFVLSVRMDHGLGGHWTGFHEISDLNIFRKPAEKIQVSLTL
jgi:hypothetical protein